MTLLIVEIENMNRTALIARWSQTFGTPVPKRISQSFLRRFLAFEAQVRQNCGLPKGFIDRLQKAACDKSAAKSPTLKSGARLIREWNGVTHVVDVTKDGFLWNGQQHSSLSAIARTIIGTRWSGPRFFGLNGATSK